MKRYEWAKANSEAFRDRSIGKISAVELRRRIKDINVQLIPGVQTRMDLNDRNV